MKRVSKFADGTILVRCRPEELRAAQPPRKPGRPVGSRSKTRAQPRPETARQAQIVKNLARQGYTAPEIAKRIGKSPATVFAVARANRIELGAHRRRRRVVADLLDTQVPALDALAERAAVDRGEIISRLLSVALEDAGKPAVKMLGKLAEPKRSWTRKADRETT